MCWPFPIQPTAAGFCLSVSQVWRPSGWVDFLGTCGKWDMPVFCHGSCREDPTAHTRPCCSTHTYIHRPTHFWDTFLLHQLYTPTVKPCRCTVDTGTITLCLLCTPVCVCVCPHVSCLLPIGDAPCWVVNLANACISLSVLPLERKVNFFLRQMATPTATTKRSADNHHDRCLYQCGGFIM